MLSGKSHLSFSKKVFAFFPACRKRNSTTQPRSNIFWEASTAVSAYCCVCVCACVRVYVCVCSVNTNQSPIQKPVWHGLTYRHSVRRYPYDVLTYMSRMLVWKLRVKKYSANERKSRENGRKEGKTKKNVFTKDMGRPNSCNGRQVCAAWKKW